MLYPSVFPIDLCLSPRRNISKLLNAMLFKPPSILGRLEKPYWSSLSRPMFLIDLIAFLYYSSSSPICLCWELGTNSLMNSLIIIFVSNFFNFKLQMLLTFERRLRIVLAWTKNSTIRCSLPSIADTKKWSIGYCLCMVVRCFLFMTVNIFSPRSDLNYPIFFISLNRQAGRLLKSIFSSSIFDYVSSNSSTSFVIHVQRWQSTKLTLMLAMVWSCFSILTKNSLQFILNWLSWLRFSSIFFMISELPSFNSSLKYSPKNILRKAILRLPSTVLASILPPIQLSNVSICTSRGLSTLR